MRYTVQRPISPSSSPTDSVFCKTCLNNQRLYTASLSQYLPDDPDAPDYEVRDKQYYDFRKRLEKRYPQICSDCEPRVRRRIEQSAYTAKTDVLRRMIDRSQQQKVITRRSWLDVVDTVGRWMWRASYVLELLSHVAGLSVLSFQYCNEDRWNSVSCRLLEICWPLLGWMPEAKSLLQWSFTVSLLSCWWNPRFVHTIRGFTKHLVGILNWYLYQLMVLFVRCVAPKIFEVVERRAADPRMLAGALIGAIIMSVLVLNISRNAIRTDTTPLFRTQASPQRIPVQERRASVDEGKKTMSDLLDEIMQTPNTSQRPQPSPQNSPSALRGWGGNFSKTSQTPSARQAAGLELRTQSTSPTLSSAPFGAPEHPSSVSSQQAADVDAMDWSPSNSQHRAFSSFRTSPGFNQAPTEPNRKGAFWFHVPPAPTSLGQRTRNPPQVRLPPQIPSPTNNVSFGGFGNPHGTRMSTSQQQSDLVDEEKPKPVLFRDPHFFPPQPKDDPRDPLTSMFAESFTLSQEEQDERDRKDKEKENGFFGRLMGNKKA